jgi:Cof subfamily protein (haloacid dehalogenase superfamily)
MTTLPGPFDRLASLRPFAQIRLIALDVDGTLADASHQGLAGLTRSLCASLSHFGVLVTIATGRSFAGVHEITEILSNENAHIVLYNGAVISDRRGNAIYRRAVIPAADVREMFRVAEDVGVTILAYNCAPTQQSLLDMSGTGLSETVVGWALLPFGQRDTNGMPIDWLASHDAAAVTDSTAILFLKADTVDMRRLIARLSAIPSISVTTSGGDYIEVRPAGVTKASALAHVIKRYGFLRTEVLTVGDNDNDIEMLDWAGIGVAVANASSKARSAADYMTAGPSAMGVLEILRKVRNARRLFKDDLRSSLWLHQH